MLVTRSDYDVAAAGRWSAIVLSSASGSLRANNQILASRLTDSV